MTNATQTTDRPEPMSAADPYFDDIMRSWIERFARKNLWQMHGSCELEDLVQEGFLIYTKCYWHLTRVSSYQNPNIDDKKWFMAFVRRSFANRITDLSGKRMRVHDVAVSQLVKEGGSEEVFWDKHRGCQDEEATFAVMLANAPKEIKELILILGREGGEALRYYRKGSGRNAVRETTNDLYCRLLGLNPANHDMVGQVRRYFSPN